MSKDLRPMTMYLEDASIEQLEKQLEKRKAEIAKGLLGKPKLLKKFDFKPLIVMMEAYHIQMVHNFHDHDDTTLSLEDIAKKAFECAYGSEIYNWHTKMTLRY